jgi:hypothetical protein
MITPNTEASRASILYDGRHAMRTLRHHPGFCAVSVVRMVVRQGLQLVTLGLIVGAFTSYLMARVVSSLLYQTEGHDLVTFVTVPIVLSVITLVACALPAYRASSHSPHYAPSDPGRWARTQRPCRRQEAGVRNQTWVSDLRRQDRCQFCQLYPTPSTVRITARFERDIAVES